MTSRVRVGIAGTGSYVPERVVPNSYFEKIVDTSDEWIVQRTGIRERRYVAEGEATSDIAVAAGRRALEAAGVLAEDLDLIVVGIVSPDQLISACLALMQHQVGSAFVSSFDLKLVCTAVMIV